MTFPVSWQQLKWSSINYEFFVVEGGRSRFSVFFQNDNVDFKCFRWTKNKLVLKWFLGNFKCCKLKFHVLRGGSENSNFSQFQIFLKLGTRGVIKFQILPKFKEVQIILGEGGVKKIVDFSTFWDIFYLGLSPKLIRLLSQSQRQRNTTQRNTTSTL